MREKILPSRAPTLQIPFEQFKSIIHTILQMIFGCPLVWSQRGLFTLRSWHPVQIKDWNRLQSSPNLECTLRNKQIQQLLPALDDQIKV